MRAIKLIKINENHIINGINYLHKSKYSIKTHWAPIIFIYLLPFIVLQCPNLLFTIKKHCANLHWFSIANKFHWNTLKIHEPIFSRVSPIAGSILTADPLLIVSNFAPITIGPRDIIKKNILQPIYLLCLKINKIHYLCLVSIYYSPIDPKERK